MAGALSSSMICMRCLGRGAASRGLGISAVAGQHAFSTSTPVSAAAAAPRRKTQVIKGKGNKRTSSGARPAPGERRAMRKRLVLSNSNAIPVADLQELGISQASLQELRGQVVNLREETVESLRGLEAFKHTQAWDLFARPAVLVRSETAVLAGDIERIDSGAETTTVRRLLTGARGSGKSVLQLQAMAMALQRGWVVLHLPDAYNIVVGHSAYQPVATPDGVRYIQPEAAQNLLAGLVAGNHKILAGLKTTHKHKLPVPVRDDISLVELAALARDDISLAWPVWQAVWAELIRPAAVDISARPKLLLTADSINHLMRNSGYLDRDAKPVHAHDLILVRDFISLLSGSASLPNGGMVLAATSGSNRPSTPTLDTCIVERTALKAGDQESVRDIWNPYIAHDTRVRSALADLELQAVPGLSKDEARGIMEYYARSGMLREKVTAGLVNQTWVLAGGGIVGELERATVRSGY